MVPRPDHVIELIDAHLHGVLTADESDFVRRHCDECRICKVALEEAEKRYDALRSLPSVEASEQLIRKTLRGIETAPRFKPHPIHYAAMAAAAAVFLVSAFHFYYWQLDASPYDLRVLGQRELHAGSQAAMRLAVFDHRTGRPVASVPIELALARSDGGETIRLASLTTDASGTAAPHVSLPDWPDGKYELHVDARPGWSTQRLVEPIELRRQWQLMLSTDKRVYQPGQVIRIRSLALRRPDLKPAAGHDVVFSITDPKGNVIFRQRGVTSRFGIASVDCPLAVEILEGAYQITCEVGGTESTATVEVRRYVLPKFKVELELDRPYYEPGQRARGTVRAEYFFGKPVAGGEASLEVVTHGAGTRRVVHQQQLVTGAEGAAAFEFQVPQGLVGRPQRSGHAEITVEATVRDTAGQSESRRTARPVAAEPIHIEVVPEAGTLVAGVTNRVFILTSYPDGTPARTRLAITGLPEEIETNDLGAAFVELTPSEDEPRWTLRAADDEGRIGRRELVLVVGRPAEDFLVRTDKAVYDGGETMTLIALGGGEPVFVDLVKDGQTMLSTAIDLRDGRGQLELDLPPELFGTIELCAYRYGASGVPVTKTRVIYVRQAGGLKVETELDEPVYRPGGRAKLRFALTDAEGRPAPGALSLAVVDEAVFSVLGQRPGLQEAFFTLEQELLQPIYALYAWSPDLFTAEPEPQRAAWEEALFALTAQRPTINRDEILRRVVERYAENDQRLLDVLNHPDLDELLETTWVPDELKALLRGGDPVHTLSVRSYPLHSREIERRREAGLEFARGAWIVLILLIGVPLGLYLLARIVTSVAEVSTLLAVVVVVAILIGLMMPALQSAREASRLTSTLNDLRQLTLALQAAEHAEGSLELVEGQTAPTPRLRQWFPETLYWRPELITDDAGRAEIEIPLADSITTWRLSASAVTAGGRLGGGEAAIRVFQPFFVDLDLPVALTRGDEVAVPVVAYNYLDRPQRVELALAEEDWFELIDDEPARTLELQPGDVLATSFRIAARKVGRHAFQVEARGGDVSDAVRREIDVDPEGRGVETVESGSLDRPAEIALDVPPEAIEGSVRAIVRIYPSRFSQLVEGLDAIFERPYGCFEQTSSTTYPNVLALQYLRRTKQNAPEVEAKARQYIHLGYQRLVSFEVAGGGFDWFGRPPAAQALTAYGLMQFADMARVHDVDPQLIERTRQWLLGRQRSDGSWQPEGHRMHEDPTRASNSPAALSTTAYIAWAVFDVQPADWRAWLARDYLRSHQAAAIDDPYVLALVANALVSLEPEGRSARPYLDRLDQLKQSSPDGKLVWWAGPDSSRTMFHGAGRGAGIETTALAALGMLRAGTHTPAVRGALGWLVTQKDARGTWHSTQATVLALKALVRGSGAALADGRPRRFEIALDGKLVRSLDVPADQADVVQQIDLSAEALPGPRRLRIVERGDTASAYQATLRYHVPDDQATVEPDGPLSVELLYDETQLAVHDVVGATAKVVNHMPTTAPMVILDLPIPPGFALLGEDLAKAVERGAIARYQLTPRSAIVYLRAIEPGQTIELRYRLRATMPVRVSAAAARAYEYYDPDTQAVGGATELVVVGR